MQRRDHGPHALVGIGQGVTTVAARTLFDKVWAAHEVVAETPDTPAVLYIDLHLIHEVTSPQAFSVLKSLKLPVRRPDRTLATMDHSTPTSTEQVFGTVPIKVDAAAKQVRQLEQNAAEFGVELFEPKRRGVLTLTTLSKRCRTATSPRSGSVACVCPAASASAYQSPERS